MGKYSRDKCAICGAKRVKLWSAEKDASMLICANCAEERQAPRSFVAIGKWEQITPGVLVGQPVPIEGAGGEMVPLEIPMPRWVIDRDGCIPMDTGPDHNGCWTRDYRLILKGSAIVPEYRRQFLRISANERVSFSPHVPDDDWDGWMKLPTHK